MAEGVVSANDLDYVTYVAYVKRGAPGCKELQAIASKFNSEVRIQDAASLPVTERPSWLKGVPMLVRLKDMQTFSGSSAIQELSAWSASQLDTQGDNNKYHVYEADTYTDSRYSDTAKDSKLTSADMEAYFRKRDGPSQQT